MASAPIPTGTYTIQDVNGKFATAPLILGQPVQFNAPTGAQNQNWLISTKLGASTIRSASLAAYAWVDMLAVAGANVNVILKEWPRWVTAVDRHNDSNELEGTIQTHDSQLFWAVNNNRVVIDTPGAAAKFIFTQVV